MGTGQQWLDDKIERRRIRIKDWQEKPPRATRYHWAQALGWRWCWGEESDEEEDGTDLGGRDKRSEVFFY